MNVTSAIHRIKRLVRDNSPIILTALGGSGTVTTAYLTAKATFTAARVIDKAQEIEDRNVKSHPLDNKEKFKLVWKLYIPAGVSGIVTIVCVIGASRTSSTKTAAAYSLLSVSEKAFTEYKEKVVEQLGPKKEQAVRDQIAQDRVNNTQQGMIVVSPGMVLCFDLHSGRYFNSDMETLKKAQNAINAKMLSQDEASLSDFYYLVGLAPTKYSDHAGWKSPKLLELYFSTTMSEDNRPCIAVDFNYFEPF